jgi:hypothetical protein
MSCALYSVRMLGRLWRNYWAGAWIAASAILVAAIGWLVPGPLIRLGVTRDVALATWFGLWGAAALLAVAGVGVWAYRFHAEP